MFKIFKKKGSPNEIADRIHLATQDLFKDIGAIPALAVMHKAALHGEVSDDDCNDLALGAYRTLTLAAGVVHYRMILETGDEDAAGRQASSFSESSALSNIVQMILETVPFNKAELNAVSNEVNQLFQAATMLERSVRQARRETAYEIWRTCAKGSYMELPMVFAGIPR